jgi:hypothetical protein
MNIKVYINSRNSNERKIVDAELIKENNKTVWVKIPNLVKHDTHFLLKGDAIIQRKKARDLVDETTIKNINRENTSGIRIYSPKIINPRGM